MSAAYPTEPRALLTELPPRLAFAHEPQNLTPWLRRNLAALSSAINVPLQLLDEKAIGAKRIADLLARDRRDGSLVVVENQLEPTDDRHLGQILTYLAGLDAAAAVWIAPRFAASHLAAARWLNAKGVARIYAVRIRVAQAFPSAPAVVFEVLERPSDRQRVAPVAKAPVRVALEGFAASFWAAYLRRFPEDAKASRPVGELCRWRSTLPKTLVIAQRIEAHGVSVFVRGRYGVPLEIAAATLAPFADQLERGLGAEVAGHSGMLAVSAVEIALIDPTNWPAASEWLRDRTQVYDTTLRSLASKAVTKSTHERRPAGRTPQ